MIARRSAVRRRSAIPASGCCSAGLSVSRGPPRPIYFFVLGGGATYGLNAPPGTADATGLSNPSLLTDETPNTQSSTRMWGRFTMAFPFAQELSADEDSCHWFASVRRHLTTYRAAAETHGQLTVVSVLTAPSTLGSGGGGALAIPASAAMFSLATFVRYGKSILSM